MNKASFLYGFNIDIPEKFERTDTYIDKMDQFAAALQDFDHFPVLIRDIKNEIKSGNEETISVTIEALKQILSRRYTMDPMGQFAAMRALKMFIELFVPQFQSAVEAELLPILAQIASFKSDSQKEDRGMYYFCYEKITEPSLMFVGQHLLTFVLECIQVWSNWFKESKFEELFNRLKGQDKITFPQKFLYFRPLMMTYSPEEMKKEQTLARQKMPWNPPAIIPKEQKDPEDLSFEEMWNPERHKCAYNSYPLDTRFDTCINRQFNNYNYYQKLLIIRLGKKAISPMFSSEYSMSSYFVARSILIKGIQQYQDEDFIQLTLNYLMETLGLLFDFQQNYIQQQQVLNPNSHPLKIMPKHRQGGYYFSDIFKPVHAMALAYKDLPQCQQILNLIASYKGYVPQSDVEIYEKKIKDAEQKFAKQLKPLENPVFLKQLALDEKSLSQFTYKRKMQILQNKLVAFQYFSLKKTQLPNSTLDEDKKLFIGKKKRHIKYFTAVNLSAVFENLIKTESLFPILLNLELRFVLDQVETKFDTKFDQNTISLCRMSFKNCSTELISSFLDKNIVTEDKVPRCIEIINCSLQNSELKEIIRKIDKVINKSVRPNYFPKVGIKWYLENCRNIYYASLEGFNHNIEKWNQVQEQSNFDYDIPYIETLNEIKLRLAIKRTKNFTANDFLKLSTFEAIRQEKQLSLIDTGQFNLWFQYRGLNSLKLKKIEGENMQNVMKEFLAARLIFPQEEVFDSDLNLCSNLTGISFDSTVCNNVDELNLDQEYFQSLRKLRFKCLDQNLKQPVTFQNMKTYSLEYLTVLKLKNCSLSSDFFKQLQIMSISTRLVTLNLKGCSFDPAELASLFRVVDFKKLSEIDISNTMADDQVCYALQHTFENQKVLQSVDISNSQTKNLTHKGLKYLTMIQSLDVLCINNCSHAVDDTLAPFIVNMLKRKTKEMSMIAKENLDELTRELHTMQEQRKETPQQIIEQQEIKLQEAENLKRNIENKISEHNKKEGNFDSSDYYTEDDSPLFLHFQQMQANEQIEDIKFIINKLTERIPLEDQRNKVIADALADINRKYQEADIHARLKCLDLSGNKRVTSGFIHALSQSPSFKSLHSINLSKTSVCGELFSSLQHLSQKKQPAIVHKTTLDDQQLNANSPPVDATQLNNQQQIEVPNQISNQQEKGESKRDVDGSPRVDKSGKENQGQVDQVQLSRISFQELTGSNETLETLNLGQCKNIKADKFDKLFSTSFPNLHELNLNDCEFFNKQFERFVRNYTKCFRKLKVLSLKYSVITNDALWSFLRTESQLLELYLDNSNFSFCPEHLKQGVFAKNKEKAASSNVRASRFADNNKQKDQVQKEEGTILPTIFIFSVSNCKLWSDNHLTEIMAQIRSPIFDFNSFLTSYRHLITKKMVYYLVKSYAQLKSYFYLNLDGAALPDIEETEADKKQKLYFYQRALMGFQKAPQIQEEKYSSGLESLIIDNTRIGYKLFAKILKYHPQIKYLSCRNTPFLHPISVEHKKKQNIDALSLDQLMGLINSKNIELTERDLVEIFIQIKNIKKDEKLLLKKSRKLYKLVLNQNQLLSPGNIDQLISSLFSYISSIHAQYTKIDAQTIQQITEKGSNIEYIGLKGCNHLSKDVLISICKSKNFSKTFRLDCVLEMKYLVDFEVITCMASSKYMTNILVLDLSCIAVPNMDDCIMSICFTAQEVSVNLRVINVENTLISDRGFQMISVSQKFKNLERIYFKGCRLITERGISFIIDSNNLMRFDLTHFINQNSYLFSGRIVDTLKYSNRRVFFRVSK